MPRPLGNGLYAPCKILIVVHADFIGTLHAKEVLEEIVICAASGTVGPSEAYLIESLNAVGGAEQKKKKKPW